MPRPNYPSDEEWNDKRRKVKPHVRVHLSARNHPKTVDVFADPEMRGMLLGLWMIASERGAAHTDDWIHLSMGDVMWITGRNRARSALVRFRSLLGLMSYSAREQPRTVSVRVRNFARKQNLLRSIPERVYFVQVGVDGPVKVGVAADVAQRIRELQVANHQKIQLLGTCDGGKDREAAIHQQFKDQKLNGEWFSPVPELLQFISTTRNSADARGAIPRTTDTSPSPSPSPELEERQKPPLRSGFSTAAEQTDAPLNGGNANADEGPKLDEELRAKLRSLNATALHHLDADPLVSWWATVDARFGAGTNVFIFDELTRMDSWLLANPSRNPRNMRGAQRFVSRWLDRAHDRERITQAKLAAAQRPRPSYGR